MKFKKLALIGFKSFANKLEVRFGEGITAIVGPNGCGKSNVADAVRWVLGEQSAKLLRGSSMQDVIFNGTQKRKAQSYAEVALTFDNHNRSLFPSYDYEEVVISRKLFRSGESEYYLNGSICRLRDISDMLRDAGFSVEGYTIIGQGRVMEIINSKPEDRRSIFEEAAGISKYKFKKNEAERKNARTRDNLIRLNDILANETERLAPLAKQAEKTRTYQDLREKQKLQEINLYMHRFETAAETKDSLSEVIAGIDGEIKAKQAEYNVASEEYNAAMTELQSIDSTIEKLHVELMNLSVDKEKISGQIGLYRQQLDSLNRQNLSIMAANTALNNNYSALVTSANEKQDELQHKSDQLRITKEQYEKLNAEYMALVQRVETAEEKINSARKAFIAAMERRAVVNRSVGELTAERASLTDQAEEVKSRIRNFDEKIEIGNALVAQKSEELDTLCAERDGLVAERDNEAQENKQCVERLNALYKELNTSKQELSALISRKKVFEDVQRDAYAHSVRKLLEDAEQDKVLKSAIVGVVGQAITVKDGFEAAVDMALGSAVNNIVTKDEDDAKLLVEHLKQHKYGRATFLPITSFKPRTIESNLMPLLKRNGCFGVATNAITYDPVFDPIMRGLLGSTVIVDNIETAVSLARDSKYGFRIVTLDGDIVTPQGAITGGSKKSDATNVFSHERALKEITVQIESKQATVQEQQSERDRLDARNIELTKHVRELTQDIHDYDLAEASKRAEHTALVGEVNIFIESKAADDETLRQITERIDNITADLDAVEKTQNELGVDERNEENARRDREFEQLRAQRDELRSAVEEKNLLLVTLGKDVETLQSDIARLKSEAIATSQRLDINNKTIVDNNHTIQECEDKIKELSESTSDGNDKRREEIKTKLNGLSEYKADLNRRTIESDKARMRCNDEMSQIMERKHEQELLLTQVDVNMDNLQQVVFNDYGMTYEDCLPFKVEDYDPEVGEIEIAKLKRRIQWLGNINPNAIEEAQELSQKCNAMSVQRDDMMKSLADEERIIKEMSQNMLRDFNDCFEKIRTNFREIFAELFNGGTADLELTENDDPLLRGVEIKAQPPAKHLQSITLLSGGEKTLTAIAILFAIMKLRPMPFCLLDEIEAALDDANVGRVANALKKFSTKTQLIVITHRKPTMEQADCLYGVTMEEKGVSSIVSVRLADALQAAESVPASE